MKVNSVDLKYQTVKKSLVHHLLTTVQTLKIRQESG